MPEEYTPEQQEQYNQDCEYQQQLDMQEIELVQAIELVNSHGLRVVPAKWEAK